MGHALYKVLMSSARSREWNVIFSFCLGSNGFSLVWDRFYMESNPRAGHPFEEPCELFASSVAAFAESPDIFQFFINVVKKDIYKSAGMLLYCYLRDEVFNGIYKDGRFYPKKTAGYEQHAAFRDINWKQLLKDSDVESYIIKAIGQDNEIIRDSAFDNLEKILESDNFTAMSVRLEKDGISVRKSESSIKQDRLIEALIDIIYNKPNIGLRRKALKALGKLTTNDTRIMRPLIHALEDPDKEYCEQAARSCTIKIIEDPIFTPLIGYMLKSSAPLANEKAKYLIGVLGLKTIIKRLIECASHKDPEIRRTAVVAIGLFGRRDKKFIPPLLKALTDDDSYVREEAARAIAVLKLRDPRFLPILLGMLKDEEVDIVGSAMDAIVVQHMRNEYIITSILALLRTDIAHKPLLYELIGKLGIGDTRFIQPLIDATNDELTRYNVEEAIKILCIDKATKKFKRRGLFAFVNKILG
jgi:HEAT repeat protein